MFYQINTEEIDIQEQTEECKADTQEDNNQECEAKTYKSCTYEFALSVMNKEKFTCSDFSSGNFVYLIHEEGTQLLYRSALLRLYKDWVFVYTEHHGYHCYHKGDLQLYMELHGVENIKLGYEKDQCQVCKDYFISKVLRYIEWTWDINSRGFKPICNLCYNEI